MRAWVNVRHSVPERLRVFESGLKRLGYAVEWGLTEKPGDRDILLTWNRIRAGDSAAKVFESLGLPVLVTENAAWGNDFAGGHWLCLGRRYHNMAGCFPVGDASRWDVLAVELAPWREIGETVILPQRGIGSPPVAMPDGWAKSIARQHAGRVRPHPGMLDCVPLDVDLAGCGHVVTWGSGAAIKALMMGVMVTSYMPNWIGEQDNTDAGRLAMFRRLAWAQWRLSEFESGEAFKRMLS